MGRTIAAVFNERELARSANRESDTDRRRHMLDLAATYQRAADQLAPPPPTTPQVFHGGAK